MTRRPPRSTLFPSTTLFRSNDEPALRGLPVTASIEMGWRDSARVVRLFGSCPEVAPAWSSSTYQILAGLGHANAIGADNISESGPKTPSEADQSRSRPLTAKRPLPVGWPGAFAAGFDTKLTLTEGSWGGSYVLSSRCAG